MSKLFFGQARVNPFLRKLKPLEDLTTTMDSQRRRIIVIQSPQNHFARLSEDSISEIISRTSPLDASRITVISKGFKAAADSDTAWERFLPMEILSRSDSPVVHGTKKELYFSLCNSPILLDGGKLSFFLDKKTGKKCFMIGSRELAISWCDDPQYWQWTSHPNSRFSEVAQLKAVGLLDIKGTINTQLLSQKTKYGVYLVFKLASLVYGLESVWGYVTLVDCETDPDTEEQASLLHLHRGHPVYRTPMPKQTGRLAVRREDEWMEIELGDFYNINGDGGEVEGRLMEIWGRHGKSGLIVEGVEFRPKTPSFYNRQIIRRN